MFFSREKLNELLKESLLVDDSSLEWTLRHGRSTAVFVCLKESPESIYTDEHRAKVDHILMDYLAADRVPVVMNGIRGCGYLLSHLQLTEKPLPAPLVTLMVRSMNHSSNEVRELMNKYCLSAIVSSKK
jgi:hypothetical protein